MRFIIIGGDERFALLARLLEAEGHSVFPLAMEKRLSLQGPPDYTGADAVILPLPAERGGFLNAPLSEGKYRLAELLEPLREGTRVLAGMAGAQLRELCRDKRLRLIDYYDSEALQIKNALLTAEGAIALMMGASGRSICSSRVVIGGFGRIGSLLAPRLRALGAEIAVIARSSADRARARALGCDAADFGERLPWEPDFAVNTVPATVFGERELRAFGGAKLIELASAPGGFDLAAAERLGLSVIPAPGLPSVCAPESAAEAIRDSIIELMEA